jgi:hypothetical protein
MIASASLSAIVGDVKIRVRPCFLPRLMLLAWMVTTQFVATIEVKRLSKDALSINISNQSLPVELLRPPKSGLRRANGVKNKRTVLN